MELTMETMTIPIGLTDLYDNNCRLWVTYYFVSVCMFARVSQKHLSKLHMLPVAVARSSSGDNAVSYVLPVLWMTSCFPIMGYIARG